MESVLKQRGKVLAFFIACGTVVAVIHPESAGTIFTALAAPTAAFAAVGEWASRKVSD